VWISNTSLEFCVYTQSRASWMLGKCYTTEPHNQLNNVFFKGKHWAHTYN
jgi:hypothetical protein